METISQRELRNDSAEVLRRVESGEVLTVTRRGVPVARMVPIDRLPVTYVKRARKKYRPQEHPLVKSEVSSDEMLAGLRDDR